LIRIGMNLTAKHRCARTLFDRNVIQRRPGGSDGDDIDRQGAHGGQDPELAVSAVVKRWPHVGVAAEEQVGHVLRYRARAPTQLVLCIQQDSPTLWRICGTREDDGRVTARAVASGQPGTHHQLHLMEHQQRHDHQPRRGRRKQHAGQ
jgi:hypothetical protein